MGLERRTGIVKNTFYILYVKTNVKINMLKWRNSAVIKKMVKWMGVSLGD